MIARRLRCATSSRCCRASRFRLLALGDVHDHAQNQRAFRTLNGADPDLDGELGPVLPPGEQLPAGAHGPRHRRGMKARPMSQMVAAEPLRHEEFYGLPDELLTFITEQFFDDRRSPARCGPPR